MAHRATRSCRVIATGGRSAAGHDRVDGTRSGGLPERTGLPTRPADSSAAAAPSGGDGASAEDVRLAELGEGVSVGVSEAPISVEESEAGSGLMSGTIPADRKHGFFPWYIPPFWVELDQVERASRVSIYGWCRWQGMSCSDRNAPA